MILAYLSSRSVAKNLYYYLSTPWFLCVFFAFVVHELFNGSILRCFFYRTNFLVAAEQSEAAPSNLWLKICEICVLSFQLLTSTKEFVRKNKLFMQNEPNFRKSQVNVTDLMTREYVQMDTWSIRKNEPKTNPIEPKTNPILANKTPERTQFKPKQTQFDPFAENTNNRAKKSFSQPEHTHPDQILSNPNIANPQYKTCDTNYTLRTTNSQFRTNTKKFNPQIPKNPNPPIPHNSLKSPFFHPKHSHHRKNAKFFQKILA